MSEVIPAKAGIQYLPRLMLQLDSPAKPGNDKKGTFSMQTCKRLTGFPG
jgi:hypothetical protein